MITLLFLKVYGSLQPGEQAGFLEEVAQRLVDAGIAVVAPAKEPEEAPIKKNGRRNKVEEVAGEEASS